MAYQAIYRKWRPAVFEDIVGQGHITQTLKNQIITGHVAHAYLFCGTRGTGKTSAAKVFSKAVNCLNPQDGSPCNECEICKGIADGSIMDVSEIDAASNTGVDNIREIREDVNYVATRAKYRVYIIDEVHMLSDGAFNALLKTLEEPPAHVIFILATTEAHKVPETILSRCQRFDFKRIRQSDIIARMKEIAYGDGYNITEDAFALLARLADGSMRDGLSILERCISACGNSIGAEDITAVLGIAGSQTCFQCTDAVAAQNPAEILSLIDKLMSDGRDLNLFIDDLTKHFRNLMVVKLANEPEELIDCPAEDFIKLKAQAEKLTFEKISHAAALLNEARADAKWVKSPRMIYELALVKLARPSLDDSREALLDRLAALETEVKNGIKVSVQTAAPEKKEEEPEQKPKKTPSAKLFTPIDVKSLTASTPVVVAARKWDAVSAVVVKQFPHVAQCVINRKITIDGEGIILIFEKNERMLKGIAATYSSQLNEAVKSATGFDLVIKTAFREDIEDNIIDYWGIDGGKETPADNAQPIRQNEVSESGDPIDRLVERFPEIVEVTDDSEFLDYKPETFEQTELDEEEEQNEEFLADDESLQMTGE